MKVPSGRRLLKFLLYAVIPSFYVLLPAFASAKAVSLEEAYRMALSTHESVKIAVEAEVQAESSLGKANSKILPTFNMESSHTRYTEQQTSGSFIIQPDDSSKVELKLTQPLYSGGKEWAGRRQAMFGIEKSRRGMEAAREDIVLATARGYYGVLKTGKDVEIKRAALKRAQERSKVASARFKVGEVTKSAVLRAEAEVAGAEASLIRAEGALRDSTNTLKRLIGAEEEIEVSEPEKHGMAALSTEELIRTALEARKDYRQALLDEKSSYEGVRYARGNFLPSLKFEGVYTWRDQNPQTTLFQEDSTSGALILTYPLFEGGLRSAELKEARSKLRESELKRLKLKRDIGVDIKEAVNNMESVRAAAESYRKQLSFAEEDYNMVFEQFKYGLATTVDVIDADATFISAERSYMSSTYDLELAILEVKYASGMLLGEIHKTDGATNTDK